MISVVIPTYNESEVIEETLRRASKALAASGEAFELIVVDDSSTDGTAELVEKLAPALPVRVLRRPGRLGLATAVVDGWNLARGDLLGVMDADLQHPPEVLTGLAAAFREPAVDVAVGSRYTPGGGTQDWALARRLMSKSATHLAATVLPWTLEKVTDPMSGMFMVRASALEGVKLDPTGYKILLEVLAKAHRRRVAEVAYVFDRRGAGSSKLGGRQSFEYLIHLARLAKSTGQLTAWIRYLAVGLLGAGIDLAVVYLAVTHLGWRLILATPVAVELGLLSNFLWNEVFTFGRLGSEEFRKAAGPARGSPALPRLWGYEKACFWGALLNLLVTLASARLGAPVTLAAAAGVVAGGLWNLAFRIPAIWRVWGSPSSLPRE